MKSWDNALNAITKEDNHSALTQSVFAAADANPEQEAKIQSLSKQSGLPVIAVRGNEKEIERRQKLEAINVDQLMAGFPALSEHLKDQDFAKIAIDDLHNLKKAEQSVPAFGKGTSNTLEEMGAATMQQGAYFSYIGMLYGLHDAEELADIAASSNRSIVDVQSRYPGYVRQYNEEMGRASGFWEASGVIVSNPGAAVRQLPVQAVNSVVPYAAGLGVGAAVGTAGGGPIGTVVGGAGGMVAGGTVVEMGAWIDAALRQRGVDVSDKEQIKAAFSDPEFVEQMKREAPAKGLTTSVIDTAFAALGGRFLSKVGKGTSIVGKVGAGAADMGVQMVGEGASEAGGQLAATGTVDTKDVAAEALLSVGSSAVETGGGYAYRKAFFKEKADAAAEQKDAQIQDINQLARESQVVQRNPEAAKSYIERVAPEESLFIDGERGVEFFQSMAPEQQAQIVGVIPGLKQKLEDAHIAGTDIEISKADYFAFIAPNIEADALKDFIKFTPQDLSIEQLRDTENLVRDFGEAEADIQSTGLTESEQTRQRIESELMNAGLTPQAAKLSAQVVGAGHSTLMNRFGLSNDQAAEVINRSFEKLRVEKTQVSEASSTAAKVSAKAKQYISSALNLKSAIDNNSIKSLDPKAVQTFLKLKEKPKSLFEYIKYLGGIRPDLTQEQIDNIKSNKGKFKKTLRDFTNLGVHAKDNPAINKLVKGKATYGLDQIATMAKDAGYLNDATPENLIALLEKEATGERVYIDDIQQQLYEAEQFTAVLDAELQRLGISANDDAATIAEKMASVGQELFQNDIYPVIDENQAIYHRFTNTDTALSRSGYAMFAEEAESVRSYGRNHFGITQENLRKSNSIYAGSEKFKGLLLSALYDNKDEQVISELDVNNDIDRLFEDLLKEANPEDIVNTAGLWDNEDLVEIIYRDVIEKNDIDVVETQDGILVFNDKIISKVNEDDSLNQDGNLLQDPRGSITFTPNNESIVKLFESSNLSTFLHEIGHFYVNVLRQVAATQGDGVEQAKADWQVMREFVGHEGDSKFNVEQEEKLARAFEAYLMEGNAPSQELRTAFDRFKAWFLNIYKSVTNLDVEIKPDLRAVFDRLLASDEQIDAMRGTFLFRPDKGVLEVLNDQERKAYLRKGEKTARAAKEKLFHKMMKQYRRENADWFKAEEASVRKEVENRVNASAVYQVTHFLQHNEMLDNPNYQGEPVKLDKRSIKETHGEETLKYLPRGVTGTKATDPGIVAEMFGFSSSDEMIQSMINLEDRQTRIDQLVKEEMFARYGDILNDGTIEREALEAMQNSDRGEQLTYELNTVAGLAGVKKVDNASFKAAAQQILDKKRVKDETRLHKGNEIKAKTSPSKYYYAEVKAAKEFGKAIGAKDYAKAAEWKRKQLMAHHMYREARAIEKEVVKAVANFRRLNKRPDKGKHKIDPQYHAMIWNLLAKFGAGSKWFMESDLHIDNISLQQVAEWANQQKDEQGAQIFITPDLVLMDGKRSIDELTIQELRSLNELVSNIEAQGRNLREFQMGEFKRDFAEVVDEVVGRIQEGLPEKPEMLEVSKFKNLWEKYWAMGIKVRSWIRALDQSEQNGLLSAAFMKPIDNSIDRLNIRLQDAGIRFKNILLKHYTKDELKKMGSSRNKVFIPELNQSVTKETLIMIGLNWGNEGNREALLAGERWSQEFAERHILSKLDLKDWEFIQDVGAYFDSYWGEISSTAQRRYGYAPKKVIHGAVETQFGTIQGWYCPIKADGDKTTNAKETSIDEALREAKSGNSLMAQTRSGHTKERVGVGLNRRRLKLKFSVITGHVNSLLRDIELGDAVKQTSRLMNNMYVKEAISSRLGVHTFNAMDLWVKDVAVGESSAGDIVTDLSNKLRSNMTTAYMGFSLRTFVQQFSGFSQSAVYLGSGGKGWKWIGKGALRLVQGWMNDPNSMDISAIHEASPFMKMRHETFNRDVNDAMALFRNDVISSDMKKIFMIHIMKAQQIIDAITWLGAYEKAISENEGMSDIEISQYADDAVRAQASGLIQDLSAIERGSLSNNGRFNSWIKLFSFMASYWNAKLNLAYEKTQAMKQGKISKAAFVGDMLTLIWLEALIGEILVGNLPDDDEDNGEEWAKWFLKQPLNVFNGGREIASAMEGFDGTSNPINEALKSFYVFGKQVIQWEFDASFFKAGSSLTGLITGLPSSQMNRIINTVDRASDDKEVGYIDLVRTRKPYEQ